MRLIFLGDVVGRSGRDAIARELPLLRERYRPDLVVVNGENAAHGFGITEDIFLGFLAAGADVVTLGNHSFDQREALIFIERYPNLLRPGELAQGLPRPRYGAGGYAFGPPRAGDAGHGPRDDRADAG